MEMLIGSSMSEPDVLSAEELCRRYSGDVCRFAAIVSRDASDAEDLAQEALLRAVRSVGSYDPARGTPKAWLWRIVVNAAHDAGRRRERARWLIESLRFGARSEAESVESIVLERMRDADLHRALNGLAHRDRTLIALRYGIGLDTAEVAAALGMSADSAGKAIRRALAKLRARLEVTH